MTKKKNLIKIPRPLAEIQKEYDFVCKQAGDVQYRVEVLKADLMNINNKMMELNHEANDAKKIEQLKEEKKEVTE